METRGMIEITGIDLAAFVKACYARSRPQGMGQLHFRPGDLDDETVASILAEGERRKAYPVSMDYVHGRAVKMTAWRDGERIFIRNDWFDHSRDLLAAVLTECGLDGDRLVHEAVEAEAA